MPYYRRRELTDTERVLAAAIGVAVGGVAFYLAQVFLQREVFEEGPPALPDLDAEEPDRATAVSGAEVATSAAGSQSEPAARGADSPSR